VSAPRVTVAIPLYGSARFFDGIAANLEAIDEPDVEILIGDRHLADDTAERLGARFAGRRNVRILTARDGIDWVAHYDLLFREARGRYFAWMPHDDRYPGDYARRLADALDGRSDALLAFGRMESESLDGRRVAPWEDPPFGSDEPWTRRTALRVFYGWNPGLAMRGLVRREPLLRAGHALRRPPRLEQADAIWVFGVALLGRLLFVPDVVCTKRFHESSAHAGWRRMHSLPRLRLLIDEAARLAPQDVPELRAGLVRGFAASVAISAWNRVPFVAEVSLARRRKLLAALFGD
jgi:GT2 family glycosyltransferase